MGKQKVCPECGAKWQSEQTCQDYLHQMLFWEAEYPRNGQVHHLAVLSYYLQHPSLYSPQGLDVAKSLLAEFVEDDVPPQAARKRMLAKFDGGRGKPKIKATKDAQGSYRGHISWNLTAADVVARGESNYCESVGKWSQTIIETLKATDNYKE